MFDKTEFQTLFTHGEYIVTGGETTAFKFLGVSNDSIRIEVGSRKRQQLPKIAALEVVVRQFDEVDPERIDKSVGTVLNAAGLPDNANETYLYGLAREYLNRTGKRADEAILDDFKVAIKEASTLSQQELEHRAAVAPARPKSYLAPARRFVRNAAVVELVRRRAAGKCEQCNQPAPFASRADGSPFLEVHHKTPLAKDGEDTVRNAIALCPNCHRKAHYG